MSVNKFKIFKVKISGGGNFSLENATQKAISQFVNDPNIVYLSHSTSVLSEDIEQSGLVKTVNKFLVVSLVYTDLKGSPYDLTRTSTATRKLVTKEVVAGKAIPKPVTQTSFDKEFMAVDPAQFGKKDAEAQASKVDKRMEPEF